jgi:GTPase SAR1 family protein
MLDQQVHWEHIIVDGYTYYLRGEGRALPGFPPVVYHKITQVNIFTYNTSNKKSFEVLHDMYAKIPTPKDGLINLELRQVPGDRYPIVIVGCRFEKKYAKYGGEREIFEKDVAKFVEQHPGCESVGEWVCDGESNENVSAAFGKAAELTHQMHLHVEAPTEQPSNGPSPDNQSVKSPSIGILNAIRSKLKRKK